MRILSFDIGIKNLAYCDIEYSNDDANDSGEMNTYNIMIKDWANIKLDCNVKDIYSISDSLFKTIDSLFTGKSYDIVVIENQPCIKAPTMKSVQLMIFSYFEMHRLQEKTGLVKFQSAKCKLNVAKNKARKEKLDYNQKKKRAIELTKEYLNDYKFYDWLTIFDSHAKKDDLSDSFLQAIYYIEINALQSI